MKPNKLRLRGFSGIRAGLGIDDITIDFSVLPDGIIAFKAPNGKGKTTIMDNMHPYRIMPSKVKKYTPDSFSYYDECYGENACREFICRFGGKLYRTLINIDATKRKQEAYLYEEGTNGAWYPLNPDGKTGSYDKVVEDIFGSPEMFFTSIFRAQNAKPLSDYAKGDIKDLFTELFGNEWIKNLAKKATAVKDYIAQTLRTLLDKKQDLSETISRKRAKETEYETIKQEIATIEAAIREAEVSKNREDEALITIRSAMALQESNKQRKSALTEEVARKEQAISDKNTEAQQKAESLSNKISSLSSELARMRLLSASAGTLESRVTRLHPFVEKARTLKQTIEQIDAEYAALRKDLDTVRKANNNVKDKTRNLEQYRLTVKHKKDLLNRELNRMTKDAAKLEKYPCKDIAVSESCPFVKDAVTAKKTIPEKQKELDAFTEESKEKDTALSEELQNLTRDLAQKKPLEDKEQKLIELRRLKTRKLTGCDRAIEMMRTLQTNLSAVTTAEKAIQETTTRIEELAVEKEEYLAQVTTETETLTSELATLVSTLSEISVDEDLTEKEEDVSKLLAGLTEELKKLRTQEGDSRKRLGIATESLRVIQENETKLKTIEQEIAFLTQEISQWTILEKALGNEGIIALEISDAGPAISSSANDLLKGYDGRYSVRIDTQTMTKDGKSLKEDLDIIVFDSLINDTKSIKKMSGGQGTWIEDAVARAICIYNSSANGKRFEVIFTDEKDGALDPDKKKAFFQAKKLIHHLGGYCQEYCITHTPELFEIADAIIELKEGSVSIINNN